ncbi:hypothetical protein C7999DRAFT_43504 [Corynascus novoguineensis]|uniref:Developmental regulatory protein wetA n=1 Tax=Corynascus novoguineensis TaxID=1126955 RepID=A0AAN7CQ79_9PEZI|nr:hypothetical protein C7999DRAFT_43504 [Corynascus novoguineensis]
MAGVQGMHFAPSGLPRSANKERVAFCWQDTVGAGSTDFFDQYVELRNSEAGSASGESRGLGQFGASGLPFSSPHMSLGEMLSPDGTPGGGGGGAQSHPSAASYENDAGSSSSPRVSRSSQHLLSLHRASTDATTLSKPETDSEGICYSSFGEAPAGGSISDSELLKLEGLTMRSPRIQIPQLSVSEPASSPPNAIGPRKASRLGAFCTKIRNKAATLQGGKKVESMSEPLTSSSTLPISTAQLGSANTSDRPRPQDLHISEPQLPFPLFTNGMSDEAQRAVADSEASLMNNYLDGPFPCGLPNGQYVPPLHPDGSVVSHAPLSTPLADGWELPMSTVDGKPLWTAPSTYMSNCDVNMWWDPSSDAMDTDLPQLSYHAASTYHAAANAHSAALNMGIQLNHQQSLEYAVQPATENANPNTFNPDGLVLHMPQPRSIPSAVLHGDVASHRPTRADHHRRPRPRAPSSGARHRHYSSGASPRKGRTTSGGGSANTSVSRIASVSPSPRQTSVALNPNGGRLHRRSVSMQTLHQPGSAAPGLSADSGAAIRKRRSWAGRRPSSSSSSLHHQYHGLAVAAAVAAAAEPTTTTTTTSAPSASADADGFVNYTPRDSALLMTGVAPSGSSKTKARREREAAERQREVGTGVHDLVGLPVKNGERCEDVGADANADADEDGNGDGGSGGLNWCGGKGMGLGLGFGSGLNSGSGQGTGIGNERRQKEAEDRAAVGAGTRNVGRRAAARAAKIEEGAKGVGVRF